MLGNRVEVFTSNRFNHKKDLFPETRASYVEGVKVTYFKRMLSIKGLDYLPELKNKLKKLIKKVDIIIFWGFRTYQAYVGYRLALKVQLPYIIETGGCLPYYIGNKYFKRIFDTIVGHSMLQKASKVIAYNEIEKKQYEKLSVNKDKIEVIPLPIDNNYLKIHKEKDGSNILKEKYCIDAKYVFLFVGRIAKIKGIDVLIKAFSKIREYIIDSCLVIVGEDNGLLNKILKITDFQRGNRNIYYLGFLQHKEVLNLMKAADLFVLPSRYDIFPNVVLEAFGMGTPVLVTEGCGLAEYIREKDIGLVSFPSVEDLSEKLLFAYQNKKQMKNMAIKGQRHISNDFSVMNISKQYEEMCKKILASS